jgi:hypothetical protein
MKRGLSNQEKMLKTRRNMPERPRDTESGLIVDSSLEGKFSAIGDKLIGN